MKYEYSKNGGIEGQHLLEVAIIKLKKGKYEMHYSSNNKTKYMAESTSKMRNNFYCFSLITISFNIFIYINNVLIKYIRILVKNQLLVK